VWSACTGHFCFVPLFALIDLHVQMVVMTMSIPTVIAVIRHKKVVTTVDNKNFD